MQSAPKPNQQPPQDIYCPILLTTMTNPHVAADGYSYQLEAIHEWFARGNKTSPMTGKPLEHINLIPNHALKNLIQEFENNFPELYKKMQEIKDHSAVLELRLAEFEKKSANALSVSSNSIFKKCAKVSGAFSLHINHTFSLGDHIPDPSSITVVEYCSSREELVLGTFYGDIICLDPRKCVVTNKLNLETYHKAHSQYAFKPQIHSLAILPHDNIIFLSGDYDVKIWNQKTNQVETTYSRNRLEPALKSFCMLTNNHVFIGCSNSVILHDPISHSIKEIETKQTINRVIKLANGYVATIGHYGYGSPHPMKHFIAIWNPYSMNRLYILEAHEDDWDKGYINCAVELPNNRLMAASKDKQLRIYDIHDGRCIEKISLNNLEIATLAILADKYIFAASTSGNYFLLDMNNYKIIAQKDVPNLYECTHVQSLANGDIYSIYDSDENIVTLSSLTVPMDLANRLKP